ncbi:MAG: DUF1906 domain-containing protein [Chloroflexi bacterium]|nr:MAG: DUF1906 domain-containing protein [Chloroflexota bacterium]
MSAGTPSTPDGASACAPAAGGAVTSLAACSDAILLSGAPGSSSTDSGQATQQAIQPSDPISTLRPAAYVQRLTLTASAVSLLPHQKVVLTATAGAPVSGTGKAIEIFDETSGTLVGACSEGGQCVVAYSAASGIHKFLAVITPPTTHLPSIRSVISSPEVSVRWAGLRLETSTAVIGPGAAMTVTATSDVSVGGGFLLQLYDADTRVRITYCGHGNTCGASLSQASAGARRIVAAVAKPSDTLPSADAGIQSDPLTLTWVAVTLTASAAYQIGSTVNLSASANADLTNTPWSIGILDEHGHLVGPPCKTGSTCTAQVIQTGGGPGTFSAEIGAIPTTTGAKTIFGRLVQQVAGPTALTNVQAKSPSVKPLRLLWGVDSCKSMTDDPNATTGVYAEIVGILGAPDFWGRYLTKTVCPGISGTEVAAAHGKGMGILPIYNDYNCSNVAGYDTGRQYATEAVGAAQRLGIPQGRGLAIDIEPPGDACPGAANLDTGFIHGWYDGVKTAGYAPIFYGDGTSGSVFATQWCYTVGALPDVAQTSYLWSFQPSLYGGFVRSNAPGFSPNLTGCLGFVHAWQYQLGSMSAIQDVDGDEATSELPLWYP